MSAKIIERPGIVICSASGAEFKHNGTAAGRDAAANKATEHQRKYLTSLGVTDVRRVPKVEHREDRSAAEVRRQRLRENYRAQPSGIPAEPIDPHLRVLEEHAKLKGPYW